MDLTSPSVDPCPYPKLSLPSVSHLFPSTVIDISDDTPVCPPVPPMREKSKFEIQQPHRTVPRLSRHSYYKCIPASGHPFYRMLLQVDCSDLTELRAHGFAMRGQFMRSSLAFRDPDVWQYQDLLTACGLYEGRGQPHANEFYDICRDGSMSVKARYVADGEDDESESSEINTLPFAPLQ